MFDARELDELVSMYGDRKGLAAIADRNTWAASTTPTGSGDIYRQPSGLHVTLGWDMTPEGDVLTYVERGTKVSSVTAEGDRWSGPEMVKIAAMFLSDTE